MKFLIGLATLSIMTATSYADDLSSCHSSCFETKQKCNLQKAHSFNSCQHDLIACKASCISGKPHKAYATTLPIDITFHPIIRLAR